MKNRGEFDDDEDDGRKGSKENDFDEFDLNSNKKESKRFFKNFPFSHDYNLSGLMYRIQTSEEEEEEEKRKRNEKRGLMPINQ